MAGHVSVTVDPLLHLILMDPPAAHLMLDDLHRQVGGQVGAGAALLDPGDRPPASAPGSPPAGAMRVVFRRGGDRSS